MVAVLLEADTRGRVRLPALHIAAKKDDVKAANLLLEVCINIFRHTLTPGFHTLSTSKYYQDQRDFEVIRSYRPKKILRARKLIPSYMSVST